MNYLGRRRLYMPFQIGVKTLCGAVALVLLTATATYGVLQSRTRWTADQRALLASLSLSHLGALPADPSNRYADDPELGRPHGAPCQWPAPRTAHGNSGTAAPTVSGSRR